MTQEETEIKDFEEGHKLLTKVLTEIEAAKKIGKNPHFRSSYATLEACNGVVKPAVNKYGLALNHRCNAEDVVTTSIRYKGVSLDESSIRLKEVVNMQKAGSAITYAKRYNIGMLFNLDTEDDDGNAAVGLPSNNTNVSRPAQQNKATEKQMWLVNKICKDKGMPLKAGLTFEEASEFIKANK